MEVQPVNSRILFILVNYFRDEEVIGFIRQELMSLLSGGEKDFRVMVVNNGSRQPEKLAKEIQAFSMADVIHAPANMGYLGAARYGLQQLENAGKPWPELVILCNTDMELKDRNLVIKMLQRLAPLDFAVAGPSVLSGRFNHHDQNPFMEERISRKRLLFLRFVFSLYPVYCLYQLLAVGKAFLKADGNRTGGKQELREVYAVHGSFLVMRSDFLHRIYKELSQAPFLFGEEIFLAELARKYGMKVIFDSNLQVIHREHATTGLWKKPALIRLMHASLDMLLKEFF